MTNYLFEIAQVLHWVKGDAPFRDRFFRDIPAALAALHAAGYPISPRASTILKRITPASLDQDYERALQPVTFADLVPSPPTQSGDFDDSEKLITINNKDFVSWLRDDESLRATFFGNPEAAYEALRWAGYELTADSRRQLQNLTADNFAARAQEILSRAGTAKALTTPIETPTKRIVNSGFAPEAAPDRPASAGAPLAADATYYFWFEVGNKVAGSIEAEEVALPGTPPDVTLQVVLYGFEDELAITPGQDVGEIYVPGEGPLRVTQAVATPANAGADLLARRLFFPVDTPSAPGRYRLRCHIYYQQTLLQSRLVTAYVAQEPPGTAPTLRAVVDYSLSQSLDGRQLQAMGKTDLSLMLNDNGNDTHGFRYFGEQGFKQDLSLGEGALKTLIERARAVLRFACWGDSGEYTADKKYKYADGPNLDRLQTDLILMAQRGFQTFNELLAPLAAGQDPWQVWDWLLPPGQIQFASKRSARLVLPLALIYDYPFDDGANLDEYTLCPTFATALAQGHALADTACFQGECPSHGEERIVCPSGFWGFRHTLGLPVTTDAAPDAPLSIPAAGQPSLLASVYTDFELLAEHETALQGLPVQWDAARTRNETLRKLKQSKAQAVYFYCHGGLAKGLPFLQVGHAQDERLLANNFLNKRIRWSQIRPLIFINGCHTTALHPENAMDFVTTLIGLSHAAGVIGTEITIFERLAVDFAEPFFAYFLGERKTVGEAIKLARLQMLQAGNPLGLVYIPFVLPALRLTD